MKARHLVYPRQGPNNAGPEFCAGCGERIFDAGTILYDPDNAEHTTEYITWTDAGNEDPPSTVRCDQD